MASDDSRAGLGRTIPALPVRDVRAAVAHYRERFGFEAPHETDDFAVILRDDAVIHLWGATDVEWRSREDLVSQPVSSGAESFIAGTASCRIEVADVDALFEELAPKGVLHQVSVEGVGATDFGTREFATVDLDDNLVTFFHWEQRRLSQQHRIARVGVPGPAGVAGREVDASDPVVVGRAGGVAGEDGSAAGCELVAAATVGDERVEVGGGSEDGGVAEPGRAARARPRGRRGRPGRAGRRRAPRGSRARAG